MIARGLLIYGGVLLLIMGALAVRGRSEDMPLSISYFAPLDPQFTAGSGWGIYQNVDGYVRRVKTAPISPNSFLEWSPDGRWMLYVCRTTIDQHDQLCLSSAAHTYIVVEELVHSPRLTRWSESSRHFTLKDAYNIAGSSLIRAYEITASDQPPRLINSVVLADYNVTAAWSPDGQQIVYSADNVLYQGDAIGQDFQPIYTHPRAMILHEWTAQGILFSDAKAALYRLVDGEAQVIWEFGALEQIVQAASHQTGVMVSSQPQTVDTLPRLTYIAAGERQHLTEMRFQWVSISEQGSIYQTDFGTPAYLRGDGTGQIIAFKNRDHALLRFPQWTPVRVLPYRVGWLALISGICVGIGIYAMQEKPDRSRMRYAYTPDVN